MAVVQFPNDLLLQDVITCVICHEATPLDKATAGFLDADGRQTFACNAHFWESNKYILGWVDFAARERLRALQFGIGSDALLGGEYA